MAVKLFLFLTCLTLGGNSLFAAADCSVTLPTDLPKFEPVMLYAASAKASYELWKPNGKTNNLPLGSRFKLVCHGKNNVITSLNEKSVLLTCKANGKFATVSGNKETELNTLGCSSIPTSDLLVTDTSCGDGTGSIFEAGFNIDSTFQPVFEICYNNKTEHTFWTHNVINGATIKYSVAESTRRSFRAEGMQYSTTVTNTAYTTKNQIKRFETYFGSDQPFVSSTMFMARGHMSPDADFIFSYEQLATYYYANCAPEFQVVNAGNWVRVESLTRTIAGNIGDDVDVYTGTLGILTLSHGTKKNVPIYVDKNDRIEAPQQYWKVVRNPNTKAAIVFISENNPFISESDVTELCPNVCKKAGVTNSAFTDTSRGYTYCCELNAFKKIYSHLPKDVTASKLLTV